MKQKDALPKGSEHADARGSTTHEAALGHWALGLGIVSTLFYYATSEGIRNFVQFVIENASKASRATGHGG